MPRFLRKEAIRLLEASVESLHLAVVALGLPRRELLRNATVHNASAIGLIGTAAELAMSSCLVQASGVNVLLLPSGQYKTGGMILEEFRKLLRDAPPSTSFITKGVDDKQQHRDELTKCVVSFRTLISARAGGLHCGIGPDREVCVVLARNVADFLDLLGQSERVRSYLPSIPRPHEEVIQRDLLANDLARRLSEQAGVEEQARLLSSVFLILPDISSAEPDWLATLDRVNVAPKKKDVAYLLDALTKAAPATLRKVGQSGVSLAVKVRPDDPDALPIRPEYLRTEFSRMPDQWRGDVANANGRLNQGVLDLPPNDFVKEVFVLGLEKVGVLSGDGVLSPHDSWPFVASSLAVQGTPGPFWFLIRRTPDLAQLKAQIQRATKIGGGYLKGNAAEAIAGIESLRSGKPLASKTRALGSLLADKEKADDKAEKLEQTVLRAVGTEKELPNDVADEVRQLAAGNGIVGAVLESIVESTDLLSAQTIRYWARVLSECTSVREDLPGLLAVSRSPDLQMANTAARKAFRLIDFLENGPTLEES